MKQLFLGVCIAVALGSIMADRAGSQTMYQTGVVSGNNVRVREQPSVNSTILLTLPVKAKVKVVDLVMTRDQQYKEWYKVYVQDKFVDGYIYSQFITIDPAYDKVYSDDKAIRIEYKNSEVKIFNNKTNTIIKEFSIVGLVHAVTVSFEKPFLFLAAYDYKNMGVTPALAGIFDIEKKEWIVKYNNEFANPGILSYSPSKRYVVIDGGTSAGVRGLTVIDLKLKKIVHNALYIPFGFNTGIKWVEDEGIQYYQEDYHCKKQMPAPTVIAENHYIKKLVQWDHKKETILEDCIPAY